MHCLVAHQKLLPHPLLAWSKTLGGQVRLHNKIPATFSGSLGGSKRKWEAGCLHRERTKRRGESSAMGMIKKKRLLASKLPWAVGLQAPRGLFPDLSSASLLSRLQYNSKSLVWCQLPCKHRAGGSGAGERGL